MDIQRELLILREQAERDDDALIKLVLILLRDHPDRARIDWLVGEILSAAMPEAMAPS